MRPKLVDPHRFRPRTPVSPTVAFVNSIRVGKAGACGCAAAACGCHPARAQLEARRAPPGAPRFRPNGPLPRRVKPVDMAGLPTCLPREVADCYPAAIGALNEIYGEPLAFDTPWGNSITEERIATEAVRKAMRRTDQFLTGSGGLLAQFLVPDGVCYDRAFRPLSEFVAARFPGFDEFLEWLRLLTGEEGRWSVPAWNSTARDYSDRRLEPMLPDGEVFIQPGMHLPRACSPIELMPRVNIPGGSNPRRIGLVPVQGLPQFLPAQFPDDIGAACRRARQHLNSALRILRMPLSAASQAVLDCWFPGATLGQLAQIRTALQRAYDALARCPADYYPESDFVVGGGGLAELSPADRRLADAAWSRGSPAVTLPGARRIALLPNWRHAAAMHLQATRMLHEGVHLGNLGTREAVVDEVGRFFNAFRFQGFVSHLTGLDYDVEWVRTQAGVGACAR